MKRVTFVSERRRPSQVWFLRILAIVLLLVAICLSSKARPAFTTPGAQEKEDFRGIPGKSVRIVPEREVGN